jgi:hypothetical protein
MFFVCYKKTSSFSSPFGELESPGTTINRLKNRSPSGILLLNIVNCVLHRETVLPVRTRKPAALAGGMPMVAPAVQDIDLFKIASRSISGWIPSFKTGTTGPSWGGSTPSSGPVNLTSWSWIAGMDKQVALFN